MSYKVAGSRLRTFLVICILLIPRWSFCQDLDEKFDYWPIDLGIRGTLGIAREQSSLSSLIDRIELGDPRSIMILVNGREDETNLETLRRLGSIPTQEIDLEVNLDSAINTIFWFDRRSPESIPAETASRFQNYATEILSRGGSVFVCGPHADLLGRYYVSKNSNNIVEQQIIRKGLNLFPDCLFDLAYSSTNGSDRLLLSILEDYPKCVGVGVEADTWLLLENRQMRVIGKGSGTLLLASGTYSSTRTHIIRDERPKIKEFDKVLVDLTQWRREAIDRTLPPFPPKETLQPNVPNGSLLIVGGGGMPANLMNRFVELAGGADQAKLVYVPCEEREQVNEEQSTVELWKRMGVKDATFIHTKDRNRANEDAAVLEPLKSATGIWFGGGRQWNLADSYYGTRAHQLMKQCLNRGGVIGGSSAGASIQASYLARATPIENYRIMAPGYERGGLGFIQGVAIDQHFSQRKRLPDLTQLVQTYPQLLGIGIDESTAIEVSGSVAHVSGRGSVFFVDGAKLEADGAPSVSKLQPGSKYDLIKREPLVP